MLTQAHEFTHIYTYTHTHTHTHTKSGQWNSGAYSNKINTTTRPTCSYIHIHTHTYIHFKRVQFTHTLQYMQLGQVFAYKHTLTLSSPTLAIFHLVLPSASHQPHQSTQLWLGAWHLMGCKFKTFYHETAMVQVWLWVPTGWVED